MAYQVRVDLFDLAAIHAWIDRQVVDIQLERIRAGFLYQLGVTDPSACRNAIQTPDDRNVDSLFGFAKVLDIAVRTDVVIGEIGKYEVDSA